MNPELPPALRSAVEGELHGVSRRDLGERAAKLSAEYRRGGGSARAIGEGADALAYALARMPATYAACAAVFAETRRMSPDFAPAGLLDVGAGPGGASWAALATWPALQTVTLFDANPPFLALAARLAAQAPRPLRDAQILRGDLTADQVHPAADLVVASYTLAEIAPNRQEAVVDALWAAAEGLLILIEPGTPAGFDRLRAARSQLVGDGALALAPCPHDGACPMEGSDWCHFVQRLPRSRDHRVTKAADAPFEDEKFAYLVAARPGVPMLARTPRVLAPPRTGKPGIELKLCGPSGVERRFVAKRDKLAHAVARRLDWGEALEG